MGGKRIVYPKECPRCREVKPEEDYPLDPSREGGRYPWCKACKAEYMRDRAQQMREDGRQAQENLVRALRRYGVDLTWYDERNDRQDGKCLICGNPPTEQVGRLSIDHNHTSMQARGLLCTHCNRGLGAFYDSPELLRRAAEYIERSGEIDVA